MSVSGASGSTLRNGSGVEGPTVPAAIARSTGGNQWDAIWYAPRCVRRDWTGGHPRRIEGGIRWFLTAVIDSRGDREQETGNPHRTEVQRGHRVVKVGLGRFDLRSSPALTAPPSELPASAWCPS